MPLDKRFIKAAITQIGASWEVRVFYSYYSLYTYEEVFVVESLELAKNRLLLERCSGHLVVLDQDSRQINLNPTS